VIPKLGIESAFCEQVCRTTGVVVIDADYRESPKNPFPAAMNDAEDVILWELSQPGKFDPTRIALSGFSAGANLARVLSVISGEIKACLEFPVVVAMYAVIDPSITPELKQAQKPLRPVPDAVARFFTNCYIPDAGAHRPTYLPVLCELGCISKACPHIHLRRRQPVFRILAEKLKNGRRLVHRRIEGVGHGWDTTAKDGTNEGKKRDEAYTLAKDILRGALGV
jgi:acetyl esterase/lipase